MKQKKHILNLLRGAIIINLLIFNCANAQEINCENIQTIENVKSIDSELDKIISHYIKNKDEKCSNSEYYLYLNFYKENTFYISRIFEDYNNFIETCDAYIIINKKYVLIVRSSYWQDFFISTGRYKNFSYCKTFNEHFFPFGYYSDSKHYKITDGVISLERTDPCSSD